MFPFQSSLVSGPIRPTRCIDICTSVQEHLNDLEIASIRGSLERIAEGTPLHIDVCPFPEQESNDILVTIVDSSLKSITEMTTLCIDIRTLGQKQFKG